ncbi:MULTISPECIES: SRPBCC family protein [Actinoplanes]|uniref:SRPBCC family protein n=1 Tax=Actinoplanes TaxID=1865 RepID=UPI0005F299C4|nr:MULTISPECIES: SRPBCC family protein [Actinoplanes]GLY02327.1 polyketide cyclase [Actinoplanes sp. NBRC 101535]
MSKAYVSAVVPGEAADVWAVIRDFDGLAAWHPGIASSEITSGHPSAVGAVRAVRFAATPAGTGERLTMLDDTRRTLGYEVIEHPFPVRRIDAVMRVHPITDSGHAFVEWWADLDVDAADEPGSVDFVIGLYGAGLTALRDRFTA